MLFNSLQFFVFLAVVLVLFYLGPKPLRRYLLLIASYFFYMSWNPKFVALLLTLTAIDYTAALWIEKRQGKRRKLFLVLSLIANLGFLGFFKYYNFLAANLATLFGFPPQSFALRHHFAFGHQLSHVPEHVIRGGRVPRGAGSGPQSDRLRVVYFLLSPVGRRADRARAGVFRRSLALGRAHQRGTTSRRFSAVSGVDQEDRLRRSLFAYRGRVFPERARAPRGDFRVDRRDRVRLSRYFSISRDTRIWRSVWRCCSASIFR